MSGTIRHNLSPWNDQKDEKLQSVLNKVHLWSIVTKLGGLGAVVDIQNSFSHGQRQLFGLARALLKQAPILVVDEGSSKSVLPVTHLWQYLLNYVQYGLGVGCFDAKNLARRASWNDNHCRSAST